MPKTFSMGILHGRMQKVYIKPLACERRTFAYDFLSTRPPPPPAPEITEKQDYVY